jgi:hypothetical protein
VLAFTTAHGPLTRLYVITPPESFDAVTVKLPPKYVGVGAAPNVVVDAAWAIVTSWVFDAARKFVVSAPLACTLHVPAPDELNVAPLTSAHGPLTRL